MAMKVILNQDMSNLGEEGDVKSVADGYGRNYLIPKGLAVPFTKKYVNIFEQKKDLIAKKKEEKKQQALGLKEKIESLEALTIKMPAGESGKLFGSVNNSAIADALAKEGITVERKKIEVSGQTLKMVGNYSIKIKLYNNEAAVLKLAIAASETKSEADKQG
ncbi:MAG: 50S ribosomal protein L9 [Spirochaetia bacterium]|jgi:large subunit ribosomal protein L9|nr:50S ribosomal protein L9 [Spirochaetia bacterium]